MGVIYINTNTNEFDVYAQIEIISVIIALISLFISIGHIIYNLIKKRTNIKLVIDFSDRNTYKTNKYFFVCIISNCSSQSVSITGIKLITKSGKEILSSMNRELVNYYDSNFDELNTGQEDFVAYSDEMPISLAPHSAKRCILCFENPEEQPIIEKSLIFTSNRTYKSKQITRVFFQAFDKLS